MSVSLKPLRIGLLGAGQVARSHVQALATRADCRLAVVFDPDQGRARDLASSTEGLEPVTSADDVFGHDVDAVIVAAPTREHFDLGRRAISAGKSVLMEKPFTRTSAEAAKLDALASGSGVVLMPAQVARFLPAVEAVRNRLADATPGRLVQAVERRFTHRTEVIPWWQEVPEFLIPHWGSHSIDVFLWLSDARVDEVRCWASSRQAGNASVDDFTLVATTTGGAVLSLHQTFSSRVQLLDWVIVWEEATASVEELRVGRWNDVELVDQDQTTAMAKGFTAQADEFVGCCLGRRHLETTVASLMPTMHALDLAVHDAGIHVS
jgi:predicted dehydrogenase